MDEYAFLAAMGSFFIVLILIAIALYVVNAIARYKYLQVRNYQNAWMAFIPFANIYACVEATYGPVNYINLYGWRAPAAVIKLWPVITYGVSFIISFIPFLGSLLSIALTVLNVAVMVQIFKDEMERLNDPQTTGFAILANIISIIGTIKLLVSSGKHAPGSQNWQADYRMLSSQAVLNGPFSFMNGSNNTAQGGYNYTAQNPNMQNGYGYTPTAPVQPQAPVQGYTAPVQPQTPVAPQAPVQGFTAPEAPVAPEAPAAPEAPVAPEAPAAPELTFTTDVPATNEENKDQQ